MRKRIRQGALIAALALVAPAVAAQAGGGAAAEGAGCPDASVFGGGVTTNVCTSCFFPIRVGTPPNFTTMPYGAAGSMCTCPGRFFGYPTTGPTLGIWIPGHLVEIVRQPYCSPTLGGSLQGAVVGAQLRLQGGKGDRSSEDSHDAFYNMHFFSFPAAQLLNNLVDSVCVANTGSDMAVLYMSEIDPTWANDSLALQLNPQASLFANPVGLAACLVDAAAASVTQPIPLLTWCAGSWGTIYPPSGHIPASGSAQQTASLAATRGMTLVHQRGLGLLTYTDAAVCRDIPMPLFPKNQYKLQVMHPMPELRSNHWIGASTLRWGEWRHIPSVGEDFVYLAWHWQECCGNP